MAYLLQQLANAVPLAALYAALAFGYAVGFGVTRRADIAYGALYAFSGQLLLLFTDVGYTRMILVLPAALAFGAAVSFAYTMGAGSSSSWPRTVRPTPRPCTPRRAGGSGRARSCQPPDFAR